MSGRASKRTVLVTGGEARSALATVRSLGRAGYRVLVGSRSGRSLAGASRFAAADLVLPAPLLDPTRYAEVVMGWVRDEGVDVLLPVTDGGCLALVGSGADLGGCRLPLPSREAFLRAADKEEVTRLGAAVGLGAPVSRTIGPNDLSRVEEIASSETVLKPARSVRGGRQHPVRFVRRGSALRAAVASLPADAFPLLLQERVVGPGVGVFMLRWEGRILASFAHRRLREKPPSGGASVLRESIALEAPTMQMAADLLAALDWEGVAMVELKVEEGTGIPYLMEVNGRFWGSLQLAIDAGVDFPRLLVEAALGMPVSAPPTYRVGVRSRWSMGDLDHLLARLRRSRRALDLPPGAPGRVRTALGFLVAFLPPTKEEVFRLGDPRPFSRELWQWLAALGR